MFLNPNESEVVPLAGLIRKTELQGELYDTVAYGQQTVTYPRPFLFTTQPQDGHFGGDPTRLARMLCLYDNAGEHFQPGQDTATAPVTRHLARSRAILFLFDPTQDPRFRTVCRSSDPAGAAQRAARLSRQETILNEAAARIRRHAGLSHGAKYDKPLVRGRDQVRRVVCTCWARVTKAIRGKREETSPASTASGSSRYPRTREILFKYCGRDRDGCRVVRQGSYVHPGQLARRSRRARSAIRIAWNPAEDDPAALGGRSHSLLRSRESCRRSFPG